LFSVAPRIPGWLPDGILLAVAVGFAARVHHPGPYAFPLRRKYCVQRLAVGVGVWSGDLTGIEESAVAIGFAPCPDAGP